MQPLTMIVLIAALAMTACSSGDAESEPAISMSSVTDANTAAPTVPPVSTAGSTGDTSRSTTLESTAALQHADSTTPPTSQPADVAVPTTADLVTDDDLARFIAAAEVPLQGTSLDGVVLAAPEIYISIAQMSCARFSDGDTFQAIADDLLVELKSDASDDDERLVGAIIGAATRTICPEHADKI